MNIKQLLQAWVLIACMLPIFALSADTPNDNTPRYLFVVSVKSGTFSENQLIVKAMPQVIYFSDRPDQIAGHILMKYFVKAWNEEDLKESPPNATLSILKEDSVINVIIEIQNAEIKNGDVIFTIKILDGKMPKSFGTASIFIDSVDNLNAS